MSWSAWCPTCPRPTCRSCNATRSRSSPRSPTTAAPDGTAVLRRVLTDSPRFLRRGGAVVLELGAGQPAALRDDIDRFGYEEVEVLRDEDGDVRGIEAALS